MELRYHVADVILFSLQGKLDVVVSYSESMLSIPARDCCTPVKCLENSKVDNLYLIVAEN